MLVDVADLRSHLDAIHEDDEGTFVWGAFDRLLAELMVRRGTGDAGVMGYRPARAVANRLVELRTIPAKLAWMLERRNHGELDPYMWMYFATSDISSYLTNVRSLFDHLAHTVDRTSVKRSSPQIGSTTSATSEMNSSIAMLKPSSFRTNGR